MPLLFEKEFRCARFNLASVCISVPRSGSKIIDKSTITWFSENTLPCFILLSAPDILALILLVFM